MAGEDELWPAASLHLRRSVDRVYDLKHKLPVEILTTETIVLAVIPEHRRTDAVDAALKALGEAIIDANSRNCGG